MQLAGKTTDKNKENSGELPSCLIVDDTDLPKTGRRKELTGKVFSHVPQKSVLAFKGLFLGYRDGKSFFAMDFSLHGEEGKNKKRPYELSTKQLKARHSKRRDNNSPGSMRKQEYFTAKIVNMIEMERTAIGQGPRFDYMFGG